MTISQNTNASPLFLLCFLLRRNAATTLWTLCWRGAWSCSAVALLSLWSNCCRLQTTWDILGRKFCGPFLWKVPEEEWHSRRVWLTWYMMHHDAQKWCFFMSGGHKETAHTPRRDQRRQILATKAEERHEVLHLIRILPLKFEPKHGCFS